MGRKTNSNAFRRCTAAEVCLAWYQNVSRYEKPTMIPASKIEDNSNREKTLGVLVLNPERNRLYVLGKAKRAPRGPM